MRLIDPTSLPVRDLWLHDDTCAGRPVRAVLVEDIENECRRPMTNRDHLNEMTDEELVYWMDSERITIRRGYLQSHTGLIAWMRELFCSSNAADTADRCVCCGEVIPEGRQVCPYCERMDKFETKLSTEHE